MKKLYTILTLALCAILPMQAQFAPVSKTINKGEQKMMRKAIASSDVTVADLEANYIVTANSAFDGSAEKWTATITADENDASRVWIHPICLFAGLDASYINPVYATFDAANGTLSIPLGQRLFGESTETAHNIVLATSTDGTDKDTEGTIVFTVTKDASGVVISNTEGIIMGVGDIQNDEWWYQALYNISFKQDIPVPYVYIYYKDVPTPERIKASQIFFDEVEGEMCISTVETITEDAIAGTYSAYAESAFQGYPSEEWQVTITRDADDNNKVWIHPIVQVEGLDAADIMPVYAMYDEAAGTLSMPLGQCVFGGEGKEYNLVTGATEDGTNVNITGNIELNVRESADAKIITLESIIGVGNLSEGDNGWWYQAYMGITFTGQSSYYAPVADIEKITRVAPEAPEMDGFFQEGNYNWETQITTDGESYQPVTYGCEFDYVTSNIDMGDLLGVPDYAGILATQWDINGFLGMLSGVVEKTMGAYSYNIEIEGENYEWLTIYNPTEGLTTAGTLTVQGTTYDIYIGEIYENSLYGNWEFMVVEGTAMYTGEGACLFLLDGGQPQLLAMFSDLMLTATGEAQFANAVVFEQPVALENVKLVNGEYKNISLKK